MCVGPSGDVDKCYAALIANMRAAKEAAEAAWNDPEQCESVLSGSMDGDAERFFPDFWP